MGWRIFHHAGLAFCCRSRLSSNVRPRNGAMVAARSATNAEHLLCCFVPGCEYITYVAKVKAPLAMAHKTRGASWLVALTSVGVRGNRLQCLSTRGVRKTSCGCSHRRLFGSRRSAFSRHLSCPVGTGVVLLPSGAQRLRALQHWVRCSRLAGITAPRLPSSSLSTVLAASTMHRTPPHRKAWPNPSFKPSPNSVAHQPSSAGPAAHFALAVWHATPSVPA